MTELNKQKRNFKKLVKSKKHQHKYNTLNQLMTNKKYNDQKYFLNNMLKKISPSRNFATVGIATESFADYFKTILTSKTPLNIPSR